MNLTPTANLNKENLLSFSEPKESKVKDTKVKCNRISIYPNGKKGPLVIENPFLFSFGVKSYKKSSMLN